MLTGFLKPTAGSAVIAGLDLNKDLKRIFKLMGVCPQDNLLWDQITGEEHLYFYGRLKGLKGDELKGAVGRALASVNLATVAKKRSGQYSGGMKRRLSVAISFMGQPQVVYLDEPSTGLDPASRRGLWEVVKSNKAGRALILTTHSMEEAEMLCDRLGIFVDGKLVCIGNPKEITNRYAGYYVFTITVPPNQEEAARRLVCKISPNSTITYALGGTLKCEFPNSDISLSGVFDMMNEAKQGGSLQVLDWGVANATLEEVFIKFAKSSNIKSEA
jgi:ABC-type multidrug transport system ATPase subunit